MRKICILFVVAISAFVFMACSNTAATSSSSQESGSAAVNEPAVYGDIFSRNSDELSFSYTDEIFLCSYQVDGKYYRSYSRLDAAKSKELDSVDIAASDSREKVFEVMSGVAVDKTDDLSAGMLAKDIVDSYVGKSGAALIDEQGVEVESTGDIDPVTIYIEWGYFEYLVTMDKSVGSYDDIEDAEQFFRDSTIKSIEFINVSPKAEDFEALTW